MSKGIPPRYSFQRDLEKAAWPISMDEYSKRPLWVETDLVPPIMANPQYYLRMVGKWDNLTSNTGPK